MNCLYLPRRISKVTRQNLGELPGSLVQHLTDSVTKTNKETKPFVIKIKECVLKAWWLAKEIVSRKRTVTQTIRQSKWCWKVFGKTKALAWIVWPCFILRTAEKTGVKLWSSGKPVARARLKPKLLYQPIKNTKKSRQWTTENVTPITWGKKRGKTRESESRSFLPLIGWEKGGS